VGEIWHGTNRENAEGIAAHGWDASRGSWNTWFGPAFHGYTNKDPVMWYPSDAPVDPATRGLWAAWRFADEKITSPHSDLQGEPAVVCVHVEIERVMNLAGVENDDLLELLRAGARKLARAYGWDREPDRRRYMDEMEKPGFPAKLLHWHWKQGYLPDLVFPQAFRIACPVPPNQGEQEALAIIDPAVILTAAISGQSV
jgi:hypothetical protein